MVGAKRGACACLRATTVAPRRHASSSPKHWSKIVSNCQRRKRSEQGPAPFTIASTLAAHYCGVKAIELLTVLLAVDPASTEQRAWDPELLAGHPACALGGQGAAESPIAYTEVLLIRAKRTRTA